MSNKRDLANGSGSGPFVRGERVLKLSELTPGDLLVVDCYQFEATNIVLITSRDNTGLNRPDIMYGKFVDPYDITYTREGAEHSGFSIWDFQLFGPASRSFYWRAIKPKPEQVNMDNFQLAYV